LRIMATEDACNREQTNRESQHAVECAWVFVEIRIVLAAGVVHQQAVASVNAMVANILNRFKWNSLYSQEN